MTGSNDNIYANIIAEQRKRAEDIGWSELGDAERRQVWDRFYDQFEFRPSIQPDEWPSIKEPSGSVTFKFADQLSDFKKTAQALNHHYLNCFSEILSGDDKVLALDWQHPCYRFQPGPKLYDLPFDDWPITAFPDGDYYIFLTEDMTHGFFGHPWEQTVCVIGEAFVDLSLKQKPEFFEALIRDSR